MTNWTETFRGTVPPWECDLTEHFTVASYFDRVEEAEANLADELGLGEWLRPPIRRAGSSAVSKANCAPGKSSMSRARLSVSMAVCASDIVSSNRRMVLS
jgi:hypothetical protein